MTWPHPLASITGLPKKGMDRPLHDKRTAWLFVKIASDVGSLWFTGRIPVDREKRSCDAAQRTRFYTTATCLVVVL